MDCGILVVKASAYPSQSQTSVWKAAKIRLVLGLSGYPSILQLIPDSHGYSSYLQSGFSLGIIPEIKVGKWNVKYTTTLVQVLLGYAGHAK